MKNTFDLHRLLRDVFAPQPGEQAVVMVDLPHGELADDADWAERRVMAGEWRQGFEALGIATLPLLTYPATGASNAELPLTGHLDGASVNLADVFAQCQIAVSMTRFSATAPLSAFTSRLPDFRAASMPNVLRRMEASALAGDYREVARRAHLLEERLERAQRADALFSTGHRCAFDLRHRHAKADDGQCPRGKSGFRVINLPSGEAFKVPYEGERPGDPSRTAGEMPVQYRGEEVVFRIEANRIADVVGTGDVAEALRAHFALDPARRNVAELGLGCNPLALVTGNVLEDEKAGFHWAYGRSEHLGGTVGPEAFTDPAHIVHHDIVYAPGCPHVVDELTVTYPDGTRELLLHKGRYPLFADPHGGDRP